MRYQNSIFHRETVSLTEAGMYLDLPANDVFQLIEDHVLPANRSAAPAIYWTVSMAALRAYRASLAEDAAIPVPHVSKRRESTPAPDDYWPAVDVVRKTPPGVYVLQSDRYFKIGCSVTPFTRIADLAGSTPHPLRVIAFLCFREPFVLEYCLHTRFADKRMNGEWFRLNDDDVRYLRRLGERMKTSRLRQAGKGRVRWSIGGRSFRTLDEAVEYLAIL